MCGRYSFSFSKERIQEELDGVEIPEPLELNFNVAPTQKGYVVANESPGKLQAFTWGLVPYWSKEGRPDGRLINARMETIETKPSFRVPFRKRRCLVLADSFYEWEKKGKERIPYRILLKNGSLLVMAGIWDVWKHGEQSLYTFSIITTHPNQEVSVLHDRMPALLLDKEARNSWLEDDEPEQLLRLLESPPNDILKVYQVRSLVNRVTQNGPELHEAAG
ncbi:MAG: SOS response-associated peptidase [Haliscomenobacter sp.]|nr:SOS response-associated peptidase [Haliscomenobacter sp.]MBK8879773.1 SOS response-associated peptidase [Haliscomenobacter sp.]